jgi:hypothetical protein
MVFLLVPSSIEGLLSMMLVTNQINKINKQDANERVELFTRKGNKSVRLDFRVKFFYNTQMKA